jgi:hypothetical protein
MENTLIKDTLLQLLTQNQQQVQHVAAKLNDENRFFRLSDDSATAIFLIQHIGEALHSLASLFFGLENNIEAKTLFVADSGQVIQVDKAQELIKTGFDLIAKAISEMPETADAWSAISETPFGKINKIQAFGILINHNNYHLGQAALALKKGRLSRVCQTWALNINELMMLLAGSQLNTDVDKGVDALEDDAANDILESLNEYFEDRPYMKSLFILAGVIEGGMDLADFEEIMDTAIDDSLELYMQVRPNGILLLRLPKATYHGTWRQENNKIYCQLLGFVRDNELDEMLIEEGWLINEEGDKLEKEILPKLVISAPLQLDSAPTEEQPAIFEIEVKELNDVFLRFEFEAAGQTHQLQLNNVNALGIEGLGEKVMND